MNRNLKKIDFIYQPAGTIRLGDYLNTHLDQPGWSQFRAAVAFVKRSGVKHIQTALENFSKRAVVSLTVGIDCGGTSLEGLQALLESVAPPNQVWIYHNENQSTFHPKVYLFKNDERADAIIGSGNLTEGGLFTNYEAHVAISLNLAKRADRAVLRNIEDVLDSWANPMWGTAQLLSPQLLNDLAKNAYVLKEKNAVEIEEGPSMRRGKERNAATALFKAVSVLKPPKSFPRRKSEPRERKNKAALAGLVGPRVERLGQVSGFVMTLQKTDVGRGRVTPGASQRSPEIFIPLAARDFDPSFWDWPNEFSPDPEKPGKMDRWGVKMRIGADIVEVNMMTWPDKHDFRLRCEALRSAGNVGDILRIERADGKKDFTYYVEIIPQGTSLYKEYSYLCENTVRNSRKKWGYY